MTVTVIVPTIGRSTLANTVKSIPDAWETIVVADGPQARHRALRYVNGHRLEALPRKAGDVGHSARNHGMSLATGDWLMFMDDDDVYAPVVRRDTAHIEGHFTGDTPVIFQMSQGVDNCRVWWETPVLKHGNVGTPMFAVPNHPEKLAEWPSQRSGDYEFIARTCENMGEPRFVKQIIALIRP